MTAKGENANRPSGAEALPDLNVAPISAELPAEQHTERPVVERAVGELGLAAGTRQHDGWLTTAGTAAQLNYGFQAVSQAKEAVRATNPEWFKPSDDHKIELERIAPGGVEAIARVLAETHAPPPKGWVSRAHIESIIGMSKNYVYRHLNALCEQRPDWRTLATQGKKKTAYHDPNVIAAMLFKDTAAIPSGWLTPETIAVAHDIPLAKVTEAAAPLLVEQPDRQMNVKGYTFVSPEIATAVTQKLVDCPEGWLKDDTLLAETGWHRNYLNLCLDKLAVVQPELITDRTVHGKTVRYADPSALAKLQAIAAETPVPQPGRPPTKSANPPPELAENERRWGNTIIPAGWTGLTAVAKAVGRSASFIKETVDALCGTHPEWVIEVGGSRGSRFFSPEIIAAVQAADTQMERVPDGWKTRLNLAKTDKVSEARIKAILDPMRAEHPEWFGVFINDRGHEATALSPDAITYFRKELAEKHPLPPKGWMLTTELLKVLSAQGVSISRETLRQKANAYREENPGWFKDYRMSTTGRNREHYGPELIALLTAQLKGLVVPEQGWAPITDLAAELGVSNRTLREYAEPYRTEHPKWFGFYIKKGAGAVEQYHPDLVRALKGEYGGRESAPEGWQALSAYRGRLGMSATNAKALAESFRGEYPEWFCYYKDRGGKWTEHIAPDLGDELIALTTDSLESRLARVAARAEREELEQGIRALVNELKAGGTPQAEEFQALLHIFGVEQAVDILYRQHPKYSKLPVPYVRGILADYLGGFMTRRPEYSVEGLERAAPLLAHEVFREALKKIIKDNCLQLLKSYEDEAMNEGSLNAVMEHLAGIRRTISNSAHREAVYQICSEVETYYRLLYTATNKPDCFVDEISEKRTFPDINQRVNVLELALHQKILISDDMGAGKSASVIIAKEILGVKQALVVVPSNVLEVWEGYLSDAVGEDGRQLGYFKPGKAPRVLLVDDIYQLRTANPDEYDYVLISQERLNENRTNALGRFGFDMLIVDEVHKLKNIRSGKRAENLITLAEHISRSNQYLALLSGTPVPNKVQDIAITLKLLYPEQFGFMPNATLVGQILEGDILDLRALLLPRLQMKPLSKNAHMPLLHEVTHTIELTSQEEDFYNTLVEEEGLTGPEKLATLRRFTLNPQLLSPTPAFTGSKLAAVNAVLQEEFATHDRLVLFVNRYIQGILRGQSIIKSLSLPKDVRVMVIDGNVNKESRLEIQQQLTHGTGKMLLLVSGQTADVGVDFSAAQGVLSYNDPWSIYDRQQQIKRVYRPGVASDITAHHFVVKGTIEQGIHHYIETKYEAIEKLLRGVPISEIEKNLLRHAENADSDEGAAQDLADYYFSSWDKTRRLYGSIKEVSEPKFRRFLAEHEEEYAKTYAELSSSRSYPANVARVAATLLSRMMRERAQQPEKMRVLDLASGPHMLQRYAPAPLTNSVVSVDVNRRHFNHTATKAIVGSFIHVPIADKSVDYVNLSLGLHYTRFTPSTRKYERLRLMQEVNRVLQVGGLASFTMVYALNLPTTAPFHATMTALGFAVVKEYTGHVTGGNHLRTQVITLEKVGDCKRNLGQLVAQIGQDNLQGLKFSKTDTAIYNARKIVQGFRLGSQHITVELSDHDQAILAEEEAAITELETLRRQYPSIRSIPAEAIITRGMARIFNGRHYVLFKRLQTDPGTVAIR